MKLFLNKKGLGLVELMVCLAVLGVIVVGIMKQMDFQMKTQSHMNQKMTADLFTQEVKELLSSEQVCRNSLGGLKLGDGGHSFSELKDHKGKVLYKSSNSTSSSGKNKIDDKIKIKKMTVLEFARDEDSENEGFLTLEVELEKLNKSMANQVFTRRIHEIRAIEKPTKFTIKATKVYSSGSYFGYMGESFGDYSQNGSSQSGAPSGFVGISNGNGNIYIYADEPLYSQIKKVKIKKLGDETSERTYTFGSGGSYSDKKKTYKGGVDNLGLSFNDPNATYEIEFLNDDEESEYRISSCKYAGMRGVASFEEENPPSSDPKSDPSTLSCASTSRPTVKCANANVRMSFQVPVLNHQESSNSFTAIVNGSGSEKCICSGRFICDGLTPNVNDSTKGTISNKKVRCISKSTFVALGLGNTINNRHINNITETSNNNNHHHHTTRYVIEGPRCPDGSSLEGGCPTSR